MAEDLLDLTRSGWGREIFFDVSKLAEECGEVAASLNKSSYTLEDTADELTDVMIVCGIIAAKKKINLATAMARKQKKRVQKLLDKYHGGVLPEGFSLRVDV